MKHAFLIAWAWLCWRLDDTRAWWQSFARELRIPGLYGGLVAARGKHLRLLGEETWGAVPKPTETPKMFRRRLTRRMHRFDFGDDDD